MVILLQLLLFLWILPLSKKKDNINKLFLFNYTQTLTLLQNEGKKSFEHLCFTLDIPQFHTSVWMDISLSIH